MTISAFFRGKLRAPLRNVRWSWGAVRRPTGQVFLRVWTYDRERIPGYVHVLGPRRGKARLGWWERREHVNELRLGKRGFGVVCTAKTYVGSGGKTIATFEQDSVVRLGKLLQRGRHVYAQD